MGQKADSVVQEGRFAGMFSNADSRDLQAGQAVLQVNVMCLRLGELQTRRGLREITFDADPQ